jgi:tryptophan-rich sensory protein
MVLNTKQKSFIGQLLLLVVGDLFLESLLPIIAGLPGGYVFVAILIRIIVYHLVAYSVYIYFYEKLRDITSERLAFFSYAVLTAYVVIWVLLFIRIMYYGDYNEFKVIHKIHGDNGLLRVLRIYFTHNSSILSALLLFPAHHIIRIFLARSNKVN